MSFVLTCYVALFEWLLWDANTQSIYVWECLATNHRLALYVCNTHTANLHFFGSANCKRTVIIRCYFGNYVCLTMFVSSAVQFVTVSSTIPVTLTQYTYSLNTFWFVAVFIIFFARMCPIWWVAVERWSLFAQKSRCVPIDNDICNEGRRRWRGGKKGPLGAAVYG